MLNKSLEFNKNTSTINFSDHETKDKHKSYILMDFQKEGIIVRLKRTKKAERDKTYRLINPMHTGNKSYHCVWCTLPDIESKFYRRTRKYNIIINRKDSICLQILNFFESVVQAVFLIDIKFQYDFSTISGIRMHNMVQKFNERFWWRIRLTPHNMYRIKPRTRCIVGDGLLQKIISLPSVNHNIITPPARKNMTCSIRVQEKVKLTLIRINMVTNFKQNNSAC